jgi:hypothetical protein
MYGTDAKYICALMADTLICTTFVIHLGREACHTQRAGLAAPKQSVTTGILARSFSPESSKRADIRIRDQLAR